MQCPFCQNEMGDAQDACPHCKRPHSPSVARHVAQGWNELKRGHEQQARTAFTRALWVTPLDDKPHLESYVAHLTQQAAVATEAATPQPGQPAQAVAAAPPPPTTAPAPALRPKTRPPSSTARIALFFNYNEKPVNIVRVMDDAVRQQAEFIRARSRRIWIVPLLLLGGLPFVYLDWRLSYNYLTFSLVALVLWGAAILSFILLMPNRSVMPVTPHPNTGPQGYWGGIVALLIAVILCYPLITLVMAIPLTLLAMIAALIMALFSVIELKRSLPSGQEFGPRFDAARTIFQTLKDDLAPKCTLMGWLDLTGAQPGKVVRQNVSSSGMPIHYYRDEWLKMKMMLCDGNLMRVSAVEHIKVRMGHWKSKRPGKSKWRPGGSLHRNEVRVAIMVNREAYDMLPLQNKPVGPFLMKPCESGEGRIMLDAFTDAAIGAQDILQLLRFAYNHLKQRGAPAATGG